MVHADNIGRGWVLRGMRAAVGSTDHPLCEQSPGVSTSGTTQYWAQAYPGLRQLQVLKEYGKNAVVASICARNVSDAAAPDFGYRAAMDAIMEGIEQPLGERCLSSALDVDSAGRVSCQVVEASLVPAGPCSCDPALARTLPSAELAATVRGRLGEGACGSGDPQCQAACLCEVQQVADVAANPANALDLCRDADDASGVEGFCYIDPASGTGTDALLEACPGDAKRRLRFVGRGLTPNTLPYLVCPEPA